MRSQPPTTTTALEIDPRQGKQDDAKATVSEWVVTTRDLRKVFGGLTAVNIDKLDFAANQITALVGPNGAGKTTLFNLLSGFDAPDHGQIYLRGKAIAGQPPHVIAKAGMVRTFQLTKALGRMSVLQNMMLGAGNQRGESLLQAPLFWRWASQERSFERRAKKLLEEFDLSHMEGEFAANLSGGQQKLLEMARALMTQPKVLLLDEPMAGVNPALTQSLLDQILALKERGQTIIFVEHDMDVVRKISDRVVVMAGGEVISEGNHAEISTDKNVIDAYLGRHHNKPLNRSPKPSPKASNGNEQ